MSIVIEDEAQLKSALTTGVNLFVGSGFSIYAKDGAGKVLPPGGVLLEELNERFGKKYTNLARLSSVLRSQHSKEFDDFLLERFSVKDIGNPAYRNLDNANLKYIFTTNIDDLIPQIVGQDGLSYIHNLRSDGECDAPNAIKYLPLHGNVDAPQNGFIFSIEEINTIYENAPTLWKYLGAAVEKFPTVFLGYSYNDSSTINALSSVRNSNINCQKQKWILLRNPDEETEEYFQENRFKIIKGDLASFLQYMAGVTKSATFPTTSAGKLKMIREMFANNIVKDNLRQLPSRPIIHYFQGMAPEWFDILSGNIVKLSKESDILNSIYDNSKHTIVTGLPISGKSTAAMQAVSEAGGFDLKLHITDLTQTKAEYLFKFLKDIRALILVDNAADDPEALMILSQPSRMKVVAMANSNDLAIVSNKIDRNLFEIVNVTDVNEQDLRRVYNSIPAKSKTPVIHIDRESNYYKSDTIFDFVVKNIKDPSIEDRFRHLLESQRMDEDQLEFIVLCAYMHNCTVPLSLEVAASYFSDRYEYQDMFELKSELDDLLSEIDDDSYDNSIEYYYPRSTALAKAIMKHAPKNVLKKVMQGVIDNVSQPMIPKYRTFRRKAFDHRISKKVFDRWEEGSAYYDDVYRYDNYNPYVLQHHALYLADKGQFEEAFAKIDAAKTKTRDSQFSIRNTHAIILFNANFGKEGEIPMSQMHESMKILSNCYNADQRKAYHAEIFAKQAIKFYQRYRTEKGLEYLKLAKKWLSDISQKEQWVNISHLSVKIDEVISDNQIKR